MPANNEPIAVSVVGPQNAFTFCLLAIGIMSLANAYRTVWPHTKNTTSNL